MLNPKTANRPALFHADPFIESKSVSKSAASLATAIKPRPAAWSVVVLFVAHQVVTVAGYGLGMRSAWR